MLINKNKSRRELSHNNRVPKIPGSRWNLATVKLLPVNNFSQKVLVLRGEFIISVNSNLTSHKYRPLEIMCRILWMELKTLKLAKKPKLLLLLLIMGMSITLPRRVTMRLLHLGG
jgi:hypothetical protein